MSTLVASFNNEAWKIRVMVFREKDKSYTINVYNFGEVGPAKQHADIRTVREALTRALDIVGEE